MMKPRIICGLVLLLAVFSAPAALAANSGVTYGTNASYIPFFTQVQNPGVTWTFTTSGISSGGDTVIHIQDWNDPQGGFIAGDDDGNGYPASKVVVPPAATTRILVVIIRAYSTASPGTCTFTATPSSGTPYSFTTSFGGVSQPVGNLSAGSHVTTVERQDGTTDTVLLAVRDSDRKHAVGFDDDDGVGAMSFIHFNEACQPCWLVSGTYSNIGTLKTNLVWDEDADTTDYDSDGLGYTLESFVLNTDPFVPDTDSDGLKDGDELLGEERSWPPVKLATWGADPLQKDLFWEIDWKKCDTASNPELCLQGDDSGKMGAGILADADFQAQRIEPIKTLFAGTGIRVHLDVGRANTNPATWYEWGNWGGATQLVDPAPPDPPLDACGSNQGSSLERAYMFHYGLGWSPDNAILGWVCFMPGPSFNAMANNPAEIVHETAHGLSIQHGGRPFAGSINYKPNYVSIMNYIYGDKGFSHGDFPIVLNPAAVKENPGLGPTAGPDVLTRLRDTWCPVTSYNNGKCVTLDSGQGTGAPIGAVDWNRDGVYEAQDVTVKGPATEWDFSWTAATFFVPPEENASGTGVITDPALAWVSAGGAAGDQLWLFARDASDQLVWARTPRTTLDANCGSFSSYSEGGSWNCADFGNASGDIGVTTTVGPQLLYGPGAAEYNNKILVVYQPTSGTLKARLVDIDPSTGNVSYEPEMTPLGPTGVTATGDVTALSTGTGQVMVWFRTGTGSGARLRQIRYLNGSWSSQGNQVWSDGTNIIPMYGIGATRGYQDTDGSPSTYAAIPVDPNGLVEFARKGPFSTSSWTKVTITCPSSCQPGDIRCFGCQNVNNNWVASTWVGTGGACPATETARPCTTVSPPGTQPMASARPGLAYQRKAGAANNVGRFYMAVTQGMAPGSKCTFPFGTPQTWTLATCGAVLIMTEGNLTAGTPSSRRLTWILPAFGVHDPNHPVLRGVSLVDDLTRDTNLRAAFGAIGAHDDTWRWGIVEPLADGIVNVNLSDFDDYAYLTGALRAALCMDGGTWPSGCVLPPWLP